MSFKKNKVGLFLSFLASHFIELDSSSPNSQLTPLLFHTPGLPGFQNPFFPLKKRQTPPGEKCPFSGMGGKNLPALTTVCNGPPFPGGQKGGLLERILRLRLLTPRKMTGFGKTLEGENFKVLKTNPKENLMPWVYWVDAVASVLDLSCAKFFWERCQKIGLEKKLFLWFLIDVFLVFGLMLCKLGF
ncbi:MAG: hypothetical protein CM15mP88_1540 [Pseudomonadota bacterium]|nr:MAG: hypothetical protein CM15mP88_1540 [Pseudomonadota bacterium]